MNIQKFFNKIVIGFKRKGQPSVPRPTEEKRYGNIGEANFVREIKSRLPNCKIKKNIIIHTEEGDAEIDCIILYENKIFAVEIKRWKGLIKKQDDGFVQCKCDKWTDEIHNKNHKSPFKQLNRAISLLKIQLSESAWINSVVFFKDADFVEIDSNDIWFNDVDELIFYIVNRGKTTRDDANRFFNKCVAADYLYYDSKSTYKTCLICDDFLSFKTKKGEIISRCDIREIEIEHYWAYDKLIIHTFTGKNYVSMRENSYVHIIDNGKKKKYALSKLDRIKLGGIV